ncbi:MAG TPA: hypothetical protein VGQ00_03870, partial [Candidatus Norongarragalinales archaeon]|nr:hypothetical protein [Candidatus Norongarragalinales archaeon]
MEPAKPYFAILPKTEKIPLLPLAAVIAIIIITAAAYFAFFAQPQAAFRALVFAGNDPLPNATVEAFAANKSLGKAVTDANGVAIFTSLPRQIITFKVTKQGYPSTTFTVDTSKTFTRRTDLLAATSQTGGFSIRFTIKNEEGRPVSGARVASSIDGKTETTFTDETGSTVVIAQRGAFIRVRASAPGFQSESLAFIAQKNTETVTLKRSEQKIEKGSIVAKVIDRTTQSGIAQATVFLYDDSTNVLIANASTSDGKAVFSDVSLGSSVYFMVEATGYVFPSSAQEQRITVSTTTSVNIALDPIGSIPSAPTTIKTVDETGKAIAATVYLGVQQSSRTLPPIESSGSVTREMSTNATYYAVAIASGRVYARTQQFRAGETQTLTLPTATSANSVTLTINPVDEDGFAATGFSIGLFENGLFALPSQENGFYDASVVFENVPKGANLEVHAADKDNPLISATENAVADVDKNITLNIRTKIAFIEISSIDFETGTSLPATFTSFYNDEKYESCSGSSCTIAVRAFDDVKITGKASGYADWLYESGSLSAGATKNVSAKFVPAAAANGTYAEFLGLTNIAGDTVTLVRPNTDYFAHFQYVSSQADEAGLAVRVGTQTDVATDIASITDYPSGEGVARSTSFTPGSSCAIDLSHNQASDDQYKYVDISLGGGYAGEVVVKIHVKETATSASKVRLFFRAYARRGALWYRDPFDNTLKFSPNATGKDGCYANAHQEEFSVINPVTQQPIESDFSEEAGISFDRFTGKLKMEPAITQLKLQIDTVMPGDALPLVSKSPECSLLYSVQASPRTQGCYRVQNNKLIFESGDSNPSCPIKVDRNFIEADKGANLTIQGACAGFSSALTLPIVINNVSVESAFVRPQGNELGEGDAAKILFIVNNKQAGRTVRTTVDQPGIADKTFTFNGPGVQAVAWRGPGTLSFLEGNKTLPGGSIYYEQAAPYLFGNVSATGMRVNSCTDFHCCASGWCTRSAFQDNIQNFRDTAEMVGNQTAFRRGNGQPFKTLFPNNHFKFYTVAQLIEGSQQILSDNGVTVAPTALSAGTCLTNNPGVYDLRAESDGTSNYSYIASVIPLQTFAYVTPCNDPVPGNQIPLCNYIFGNSSCINTRSNSNLLTLSQNKELHYDYRVCMYPTTPVLSAPFCAVGLTPASVGFKWWQAHANAQKACEEQADAECPGYCSGSAAKCGTAGAVGGPYGAAIGA